MPGRTECPLGKADTANLSVVKGKKPFRPVPATWPRKMRMEKYVKSQPSRGVEEKPVRGAEYPSRPTQICPRPRWADGLVGAMRSNLTKVPLCKFDAAVGVDGMINGNKLLTAWFAAGSYSGDTPVVGLEGVADSAALIALLKAHRKMLFPVKSAAQTVKTAWVEKGRRAESKPPRMRRVWVAKRIKEPPSSEPLVLVGDIPICGGVYGVESDFVRGVVGASPEGCCYHKYALTMPPAVAVRFLALVGNSGPLPADEVLQAFSTCGAVDTPGPYPVLAAGDVYHVTDDGSETGANVAIALVAAGRALVGADPQKMMEQCAAVNASSICTNATSSWFRESYGSLLAVETKLTPSQKNMISEECGAFIKFVDQKAVTHDHPVIAAYREIARKTHDAMTQISSSNYRAKTLMLGVSMREVSNHWENESVYFNYNGSESKDTTRFVTSALERLAKGKSKRARGREEVDVKIGNINAMIRQLMSTGSLPDRFDQEMTNKYEVLVAEDVGYNFLTDDWIDLFEKTGALVCHGYMALPWELAFDEVVKSPTYRYMEMDVTDMKTGRKVRNASMAFAYCTAYCHSKKAWSTLMRKPVMKRGDIVLSVEFTSRAGPMTTFTIRRVLNSLGERVVRGLELPRSMLPVKVLDVLSCVGKDGRINKTLEYVLMKRDEFYELGNYIMSLDEKSLRVPVVMSYLRRKVQGVSLVNAELVKPWYINPDKILTITITAMIHTQEQLSLSNKVFANLDVGSKMERWRSAARRWFSDYFDTASSLIALIFRGHLEGKLVLNCEEYRFQTSSISPLVNEDLSIKIVRDCDDTVLVGHVDEICSFCDLMVPHLGEQEVVCKRGETHYEFKLSQEEIDLFMANLANDDKLAPGLREVKQRCKKTFPRTEFKMPPTRVIYIKGGPGSGKSRLIRSLATKDDLVVAPYAKLMADYRGFNFATQDRAMEKTGHRRIFVDEFTAFPYEYLAGIVYNNAAEVVFLVGDLGQTGTIEGLEGMAIGNRLPFEEMEEHGLVKNFRNPEDSVAIVNASFGYTMKPVKTDFGFRFRCIDMYNPNAHEVPLCYTKNTAKSMGYDVDTEKVTVRSNQGSTHDRTALFFTEHDKNVTHIDCLNVVAFSRHRERCVFYYTEAMRGEIIKYKQQFDKLVDAVVPPPTQNTCLLDALVKILGSTTRTNYDMPQLWRDLVCIVGIDEARSLRNTMLTTDHLDKLCRDLHISVQLKRTGVATQVFGYGPMAGTVSYEKSHFKATATTDRVSQGLASLLPTYRPRLHSAITRGSKPITGKWGDVSTSDSSGDDFVGPSGMGLAMQGASGTILEMREYDADSEDIEIQGGEDETVAMVPIVEEAEELPVQGGADDVPVFNQDFVDHIDTFQTMEPGFVIVPEPEDVETRVQAPLEQTGCDAYLLLKESFDTFQGSPAQFTNEEAARTIENSFSKGTINGTLLDGLNARMHPEKKEIHYHSIASVGMGLSYHQKSVWQELQCLQSRYYGKGLSATYDIHGEKIAHYIADLFVDEHMRPEKASLDYSEMNDVTLSSWRAMRSKNYEPQTNLVDGGTNVSTVRFHMKDIFKPFKGSVDIYKAGQGISAWSRESQSLFQTGSRIINLCFHRSLNDNVLYDNLVTEEVILKKANMLLSSLPRVCVNGVIDATACDSGQNAFTQEIEKRILSRLGVCPMYIAWYYRFRREYYMCAKSASAKVEWIKTSGEPATLLGNTILMMSLMNALLRGEGPCVLLGKGDDGLKRQANLKYNEDIVKMFTPYTKLQFKVDIDQPVNFCGYALVGSGLYPCVMRKAQKVSGHKFRDYSHFREYQQSLRDWVLLVNKLGLDETCYVTARFCGKPYEVVKGHFEAIQSLTHINYSQFQAYMPRKTLLVDDEIPQHRQSKKMGFNFDAIL